MEAITVDFELIAQSMRDLSRESDDYYLDRKTGKVIGLSRAIVRSLAQESVEERQSLPEWDAQMMPLAREIVLMGSSTYIRIPEAFGCPEHRWMWEFSSSVTVLKLKQKLFSALRGRGSCKRFKEILKDYPEESKRWTEFRSRQWKSRIQTWLESFSILAIDEFPKKSSSKAKT